MLKRIAPCLFVMVGCGGTPPPPHVPSEARSSAKAGPHPSSAEPKLPTACERAQQKRLKASKLYPQGYVQRSQRLTEQASTLCPAEQQASKALLSEIAASAIDHRGQSGDDLWAKSETARAAGDLPAARRLASSASSAFAKAGTPASAWEGVGALRPLALSGDGSKLAAADPEAKLVLLEARTLKPLRFLEVPKTRDVKVARFSPDGAVLGVLTSRGVLLLDTSSGVLKRTLSWAGELSTQFAFSKDGTSVVVGGYSRRSATVRRFEIASGDAQAEYQLAKGHGVSALAVSERDGRVAVGFETGKLELLDGTTLKSVKVLGDGKQRRPQLLAFSPVEDRLAMLSDDTRLAVLDTASGKPILDVDIGQAGQHSICRFSSDGTRVLLNGGDRREALLEFDAKDGHALRAKPMPSRDLVLAPDGKLAVASANGRIGLFVVDTTSGEVIRSATTPSIRLKGMAFTDGALAIARQLSRGSDQRVEVLLTSARAPSSHFLTVPGYSAKLTFSEAG
ncbi:MAG: WD40 repeat domain-containing protein, partial [Myxococcales bacterium]|nr:WD40 repeat domain-containing protein [Myxococcales bacterium]